jgi:hypothetical protein
VDSLCDDLLLLTVFAYRGRLAQAYAIGNALMAAELIRLAARGQIDIVDDVIVITAEEPTGDYELDVALVEIGEWDGPPRPEEWVAQPRPRIWGSYLDRLEAAGAVRAQTRFSATRWLITDASRLAEARGRLDSVAASVGEVDLDQAAYAGLACAIGLDFRLYRGRAQSAERDRLREIAAGRWTASPIAESDFGDSVGTTSLAAIEAVTQAAVRAASQAAALATVGTADPGYAGA